MIAFAFLLYGCFVAASLVALASLWLEFNRRDRAAAMAAHPSSPERQARTTDWDAAFERELQGGQ